MAWGLTEVLILSAMIVVIAAVAWLLNWPLAAPSGWPEALRRA